MTAAQFINKLLIQPRFINFQIRVGKQTVTIETLNIISFKSRTVPPNIDAVFFHCRNQHSSRHSATQWGGIKISCSAGRNMKRA